MTIDLQGCQTIAQAEERAFFIGLSALRGRNIERPLSPDMIAIALSQGLCIPAAKVRRRAQLELSRLAGQSGGGSAA